MIGIGSAIVQVIQGALGIAVMVLFARAAFVDRRDATAQASISGKVPTGDDTIHRDGFKAASAQSRYSTRFVKHKHS